MSREMDFSKYSIESFGSQGVYDLSYRLIPEMATAFDVDMPYEPNVQALKQLINVIGPAKTLQDNIGLVQERLATDGDALQIATDWVDRSGVMTPVYRSYTHGDEAIPEHFDTVVFNTGVARWMMRRANTLIGLHDQGVSFGQAIIFAGQRPMKSSEHQTVAQLENELSSTQKKDGKITEAIYARRVLLPILHEAGIDIELAIADSDRGDEIFEFGIQHNESMLDGSVLAIGNAPSAIQVAGQFREVARKISPVFNNNGTTPPLYMVGDTYPLARSEDELESPATHQNPFTALGQIARNALYLQRTIETYAN